MTTSGGSNWSKKAANAVLVLLVVAAGARVAYELLMPFVPTLVILVMLGAVYAVTLGRGRG